MMRSIRGLLAAIAFLLVVPLVVVNSALFAIEADITVHFVAAVGFLLLALAAFDFRTPKWIMWAACVAASISAVSYVLQGVSNLVPNNSTLFYLAFTILGQQLERVLPDVLILWFVAILLTDSHGTTRIFGLAVMAAVVGVEVLSYGSRLFGGSIYDAAPILRAAILLPFVWLPFESARKASPVLGQPAVLRPSSASA
jgi:hypothetical protein